MTLALRLTDLTVSYDRVPALHHVSVDIVAGTLTALVGPNGAGKSSLLKAVAGILPAVEGSIAMPGTVPGAIGYLPQQAEIDRSFPINVIDVVLLGLWRKLGPFRGIDRAGRQAALDALAALDIAHLAARPIAALSAGQFQRVLFARLLVQDARLLLLDEPFNAIDSRTTADLLRLIARWHAEGRTIICVLHDMEVVRAHFPDAILLARHLVAAGPTGGVLSAANLDRARNLAQDGFDMPFGTAA